LTTTTTLGKFQPLKTWLGIVVGCKFLTSPSPLLKKKRSEKRMSLYEAQDSIDQKKEDLLTDIESRLKQKTTLKELFTIKWKLI
jgi:hypothetical protein